MICLDRDWPLIEGNEGGSQRGGSSGRQSRTWLRDVHLGIDGTPKGVAVPHCAISRLVLNTNYVELGPTDRIAHLSNVCFDAATFEIWGPCSMGRRRIIPRAVALDPDRFAAEVEGRQSQHGLL